MTKLRRFPGNSKCCVFSLLGALLLGGALSALTAASPQNASQQELLSQADEILQQMSEITGMPIKGTVNKQIVSRAEVEKYLIQNLQEEMTPAELHAQEVLVRAFGLVSRDFDLKKFLISFYTEQAAGFYDPKRKTMFIADWVPADTQAMVLSHELTHALQDQNWDLESYLHGARGDDDATNARQAVVEGQATAAMLQQVAGGLDLGQLGSIAPLMDMVVHQQFEEYPAFSNAPFFFRMEALFPYMQGTDFILAGLQNGGWKNLKVLFEDPPTSTKQIFEPQTYFSHQAFPAVALDHPPALDGVPGLSFLTENSMGEIGYYALLGQLISEDEAKAIYESWRADRYLLYERSGGNDYTLVARTRWAGPEQAQEFFRDYHTILANKYSDLTTSQRSSPDEFIGSAANGAILVERNGDQVAWAEGVPPAKTETMLAWLRAL